MLCRASVPARSLVHRVRAWGEAARAGRGTPGAPVRFRVTSQPATLSASPARAPLPEALRRDIAAMVRALPDEELLELVGDRLAALVARHAALAPPAPRPAPNPPAKPRPRQARSEPAPTPLALEEAAPERRRNAPMLPWPRTAD